MKKWLESPRAAEDIFCMVCKRWSICHEVDDVGIICKSCYSKARECKHEGCTTLATKATKWECRAHYVGEYDELHVDDFGGFKRSAIADLEAADPKLESGGGFLAKLTTSMIKKGIPTRVKRSGNSYCLVRVENQQG
jgi:hypothetical protein